MVKFIHVDNQNDAVPDPDAEMGGGGGGKKKGLPGAPRPPPRAPQCDVL